MDAGRWQRVQELFHEARARPSADRDAFLDDACDDPEIRAEVVALLEATPAEKTTFLDPPARLEEPTTERETVGLSLLAGRRLGDCELKDLIGEGGWRTHIRWDLHRLNMIWNGGDGKAAREIWQSVEPRMRAIATHDETSISARDMLPMAERLTGDSLYYEDGEREKALERGLAEAYSDLALLHWKRDKLPEARTAWSESKKLLESIEARYPGTWGIKDSIEKVKKSIADCDAAIATGRKDG